MCYLYVRWMLLQLSLAANLCVEEASKKDIERRKREIQKGELSVVESWNGGFMRVW